MYADRKKVRTEQNQSIQQSASSEAVLVHYKEIHSVLYYIISRVTTTLSMTSSGWSQIAAITTLLILLGLGGSRTTQAFSPSELSFHRIANLRIPILAPSVINRNLVRLRESPVEDPPIPGQFETQQPQHEASSGIVIPRGNTLGIIGTQSLLVPVAVVLSFLLHTPNYGFGPNIDFSWDQVLIGLECTLPLGILAVLLDTIEEKVSALQEVTKATQRAVVSFLGSQFRPLPTTLAAVGIGLAAGFGEELLFRGVFQYALVDQQHLPLTVGIAITSIGFGLLHAVTPVYLLLATAASVYFGWLYAAFGNLAVPIVCHAVYDVGALVYAHQEIGRMTQDELRALIENK